MNQEFAAEVAVASQLADPVANAAFLEALDRKLTRDRGNLELLQNKAAVLRRVGDVSAARECFEQIMSVTPADQISFGSQHSITPLNLIDAEGHRAAPIMVLDGFLCNQAHDDLYAHTIRSEKQFRPARLSGEDRRYDPEKRETLVLEKIGYAQDLFESFVNENLSHMRQSLGLPHFDVLKVELKITNHIDGGFFNTHCDNHGPWEDQGRAITWLYYFGKTPSAFSGGELYIFDTNTKANTYTPHSFTKICPQPNRLIAFPSHFRHAVAPTRLRSRKFADGRFAVSSHISKMECPK
uniref:2OG-Fe(II) oxygenase n=1 Tax=uncultured Erythrobacter sp. TaxID=263913 RepID=UPI0026033825|nr:2OG-Fe(II) oxygenase [uncultured Erythrobacter sp.]